MFRCCSARPAKSATRRWSDPFSTRGTGMTRDDRDERADVLDPFDPEMAALTRQERERQLSTINLIASENFASPYATCLEGSIWANKNGEGYPGKRFVAGCELADRVETIAIARAKALFGCEHANVQSMSATIGNVAILNALLKPGDLILSMELTHGGHLSHGAKFHYSGKAFKAVHYGVDRATERIDMEQVRSLAREHRPKMIICGCSSYPRTIDYAAFGAIATSVGAILLVDLAHNVGLVAAGVIPLPVSPRGCGLHVDAQDVPGPARRRAHPLQAGIRRDDRPRALSGSAGGPEAGPDCCEGGALQGMHDAGIQALRQAGDRQRAGAGGRVP